MSSPFPGMDPYLESPELWPDFHQNLAVECQGQLNAQLSPRYYASVSVWTASDAIILSTAHITYPDIGIYEQGERLQEAAVVYASQHNEIPPAPIRRPAPFPVEVKLFAVRIYRTGSSELVTSIEILSPTNKHAAGLEKYRRKREELLQSRVHLVEVDLLRGGEHPGPEVNQPPLDTDYVLLVNRTVDSTNRISEIWPVAVNESLPLIPIPLLPADPDVPLNLGAAINTIYARAAYERRIDYSQPAPPPALRPVVSTWWATRLKTPQS